MFSSKLRKTTDIKHAIHNRSACDMEVLSKQNDLHVTRESKTPQRDHCLIKVCMLIPMRKTPLWVYNLHFCCCRFLSKATFQVFSKFFPSFPIWFNRYLIQLCSSSLLSSMDTFQAKEKIKCCQLSLLLQSLLSSANHSSQFTVC